MNIAVTSIGSIAWETWQRDQPARVLGVTSRGVFLAIEQRILFISCEQWRGPLTINLDRSVDQLCALEVGAEAIFADARLIFPAASISLFASTAEIWHPPSPALLPGPIGQQRDNAQRLARSVTSRAIDRGFAPLLNPLLDLPLDGPLSREHSAVLVILQTLRHALQHDDLASVQAGISQLLGRGTGLTPSGDDGVLGLLLMLNRWPRGIDRAELNRYVIDLAYRRTTTLSANLIECAAAGQADERLIAVADGIALGSAAVEECIDDLLSWGSSSGIDALLGMVLAVSCT